MEQMADNILNEELDHVDFLFDGFNSVLNGTQEDFDTMTGNESFYVFHLDAMRYAGTENKFTDGIKKAAQQLYESITTMLKRINDYFFGDGQKAAEKASGDAKETLDALMAMDGNTPIPDDSPARNPEAIMKSLDGGVEFNEVKEENSDLSSVMSRISTAAAKLKDCDTVAKLRLVYTDIKKSADGGIQSVSQSLRKCLSEANEAANKLRSAKIPKEDDTSEVKSAIQQENKESADEAKEETKKARIIGGMRNKIVGALNSMSSVAKGIKEKPAKSDFKG
jgi:gas vesicle protein